MAGNAHIEIDGTRSLLSVTAIAGDLPTAWDELRRLSSLPHVATLGEAHGFRVEDMARLSALANPVEEVRRWLRRRLPEECRLDVRDARSPDQVALVAGFERRGASGRSQRSTYLREADGRVRVEAFELHPAEHCNLRCAHCCNLSPYLQPALQPVATIARVCREIARFLRVDVFKLSGGEPLLHPDIAEILAEVRSSGISDVVRLFTNGLLLPRMPDAFWKALDQLTVSCYASAPLSPAMLAEIRGKAEAFDVVLNLKPIDDFYEMLATEATVDPARLRQTYHDCWLRHRCLMVRRDVFYMCTRGAYADEFHGIILKDAAAGHPQDGIPLGGQDFAERLLAYLNRREPLAVCAYCRGSDGSPHPHVQLTPADVRAGRITRKEGEGA
jgi:hypothetical protein